MVHFVTICPINFCMSVMCGVVCVYMCVGVLACVGKHGGQTLMLGHFPQSFSTLVSPPEHELHYFRLAGQQVPEVKSCVLCLALTWVLKIHM